jgi:hypothetical protein
VFGFLSDVFPIAGQHRKPYLSIGALLYSVALISYALSGVEDVVMLALALFTATMGMIMMDVMADTMVSTDLWPNAALIRQCDVLFIYSVWSGRDSSPRPSKDRCSPATTPSVSQVIPQHYQRPTLHYRTSIPLLNEC